MAEREKKKRITMGYLQIDRMLPGEFTRRSELLLMPRMNLVVSSSVHEMRSLRTKVMPKHNQKRIVVGVVVVVAHGCCDEIRFVSQTESFPWAHLCRYERLRFPIPNDV